MLCTNMTTTLEHHTTNSSNSSSSSSSNSTSSNNNNNNNNNNTTSSGGSNNNPASSSSPNLQQSSSSLVVVGGADDGGGGGVGGLINSISGCNSNSNNNNNININSLNLNNNNNSIQCEPIRPTQQHDSTPSHAASLMGHPSSVGGVPEYTILTPVTPMRSSNQMSATEQQAQQVSHTTSATILTDLDATGVIHEEHQQQPAAQQQDDDSKLGELQIKREQSEQSADSTGASNQLVAEQHQADKHLQQCLIAAGAAADGQADQTTATTTTTNQSDGSQQQQHYHVGDTHDTNAPLTSSISPSHSNNNNNNIIINEIKIEPTQPSSNSTTDSHGPLTELTPAAIGTTLSELTTVLPLHQQQHQHHHQQQQPPQHQQQQHQQQQQQQQQAQQRNLEQDHHEQQANHLTLVGTANQASHHDSLQQRLASSVEQQQQQQQQLNSTADGQHLLLGPDEHQQHLQQHAELLAVGQQQQQMGQMHRQSGELIAAPGCLVGASNASTSSACSSASNTGASSTGGGGAGVSLASSVGGGSSVGGSSAAGGGTGGGGGKRRTWNQVNRNLNKTEIAKVYSQYGFRCYLETPISTCRRKEEDRITYINKGEFYGLSLEYVPDPQKPLRSAIVKTVVMLVFREEKPPEEDLKSWQFWHSRQHSAKQRILDADNKNHVNVINQIEEISLNAIAFYWNPIDTRTAKLNVAVQCLSTDFSNQKGVKGLPLNLQVDIYDLFTETSTPVFRGYATLLSYCDKGAQRRSRDEERRALKRKLTDTSSVASLAAGGQAASQKKFEDLYHKPCDRSEFYSMADLIKPPTLYTPSEESLIDGPKQPMSQSSGVSITPISATTPVPNMDALQQHSSQQYGSQQQQQQQQPQQQHQPQLVPQSVVQAQHLGQVGSISATVINAPQPGRPVPHSSYSIVPAADYLGHPTQALANTASLAPPQQQSAHGSMLSMGGPVVAPQQQQQPPPPQQQQQQQQLQQHHHYHAMGNTLQPSAYGVIQTDHHQPHQYAILQAPSSIPMMQSTHHQQHQQQMVAPSAASQQHQAAMVDARQQQQQQQQQQPIMMNQSAMMQQQSAQQQQQTTQQQQHQMQQQYQQPVVGFNTTSVPMGQAAFNKRAKMYPDERVLIYAKQADEKDFYPLHLSPPSLSGLVYAIEQKYKIDSTKVANIYKKSKKGIRVQMDDEMIRHYCNEDMVQLEVIQTSDSRLEITLVEL